MYEIRIDETGRNNLKEGACLFNIETKRVNTLQEIKAFLIERYGKMPSVKNKLYVDGKDNTPIEIGFTYSFWNSDISHNSKKWFQTDWVVITDHTVNYIDLDELKLKE